MQKEVKVKDNYYVYTYSDEGRAIIREGIIYTDALDPHFLGRRYEEAENFLSEEERKSVPLY